MGIGFSAQTFQLLEGIRDNNNREWFHANKAEIKEHCQDPFAFLLVCATQELSDHSVRLSGGKQTMFRLNRDVRFAKNKDPYNYHVSGTLTRSGLKNEQGGLVYLRLDPSGGRLGAGYFGLTAKRMGPIRDRILEDPDRFKTLVEDLAKHDLEFGTESSLTNMPRGFTDKADHELAWALRMKNFMVTRPMKRNDWKGDGVVETVVDFVKATTAVLEFGLVSVDKPKV
ncbi:TIGR02453 family protein [Litorimonas cladophorae]|uniref:TIGR02453 family protein n=1 Tax=Litorimonas cladophorae TaxID=1220491 RepID=A0A918KC88_9PROT|nr:DUF2461 domain-containing protein [Litorimonas cladophorae]GGX58613.1 TIGR02453 family protein [Litorimonas cladophorae]